MSLPIPKPYRVTLGIVDTRRPGEPAMLHIVKTIAYDAMDAGMQAGIELTKQGLLTHETLEMGLKFEVHAVQPDFPPFADDPRVEGEERGTLAHRLARYLLTQGH